MFIDESEVLNCLFLLCCFCFLSLWLFVFALYIELLLYWVHACLCAKSLQCCLTVTLWTVASMGFLGKNTGVGCRALLQGIFFTQGSNPHLLHFRQIFFTAEPPIEANIECIYIFDCYIFFLD